uniref:F-box domain-containing protein n=1 Tax=Meloidogyne enterolobii TaxID=390850 RepID=A0A6V7TS79_MELEN|nr:unnamed protein product [Meloidogyne enterolobii]
MLYSFPNETKLDIFKCLNYQQLLAFKLSNVYFRDFINKYEGNLAKEKFEKISIGNLIGGMKISRKFIKQVAYTFDFSLTEEPEEKFRNGLKEPISLYLNVSGPEDEDVPLILEKGFILEKGYLVEKSHIIQLPAMIESKQDIQIIYYYLKKLFKCSFKLCYFGNHIFNPKLIELLFGEAKQFYVENCNITTQSYNIEILLQFMLNNLASKYHLIRLHHMNYDVIMKYKDDLFKFYQVEETSLEKFMWNSDLGQIFIWNFIMILLSLSQHPTFRRWYLSFLLVSAVSKYLLLIKLTIFTIQMLKLRFVMKGSSILLKLQ